MKVFTSYYGRRFKGVEIEPVGISLSIPEWFKGRIIAELAPSWVIKNLPKGEFEGEYEKLIKSRRKVIEERLKLFKGDIAILCYEKDPADCHRSVAGKVLKEWGYEVVGEYIPKEELKPKEEEDVQQTLCF